VRPFNSLVTKAAGLLSLLAASFRLSAGCAASPPEDITDVGDGAASEGSEGGSSDAFPTGSSSGSTPFGSSSSSGGSPTGGSSSSGSPSSSGAASSSSSSGGVASSSGSPSGSGSSSGGPSTGGPPTTGVCANGGTRILTNSQPNAFVDDFEEAALSAGWSSYNDVTPANSFQLMQVSGGAVGTLHSGSYAGTGAITTANGGFGVGLVYNTAIDPGAGVYCIDISAFTGVSFWAKAETAGSTITVNFVLPQTNMATTNDAGVPTGGDCESNCFNHPRVSVSLSTSWAQYTAAFATAAGGSATVGSVIQELAWLSPDSNWSFTLDEIAFYAGTPPAGAVGPNPN
jgi:hypothetical protein